MPSVSVLKSQIPIVFGEWRTQTLYELKVWEVSEDLGLKHCFLSYHKEKGYTLTRQFGEYPREIFNKLSL